MNGPMGFHRWRSPLRTYENLGDRARELRREMTEAETLLWERLRNRRLNGLKFRRQHVIGRFIADFCCPAAMLTVEVDGGVHDQQVEEDAVRDRELRAAGFRVIRIGNAEIVSDRDAVLARIAEAAQSKRDGA